ncbi:MAG: hypothetical protein KAJ24_07980, partial [Candidatus Aenigmarchaeota archaeon]|nr:hypothetical protein [Candidatus Aenigmarchaeota archaeon]
LKPAFEWSEYLDSVNTTAFEIISNQTTNYEPPLVRSWHINPMFNPSMILSGDNNIEARIDYMGQSLNDSRVSVSAKILYLNRSDASAAVQLGYNSERQMFNGTLNPGSLGVTAGKYFLLLNATNVSGTSIYTSTMIMPMYAFDFQAGLDLGGFTFGTNQTISGKIFAFNESGPIAANTTPIIVEMTDPSGVLVDIAGKVSVSGIADGMGSINITMPEKVGFYNILVKINASGKVGVSDNWVQISNLNIQAMTDNFNYQPGDSVALTVKISNASSGAVIEGAAIEVSVDSKNTPAMGLTDATGKAVVALDPLIYGDSGGWTFGWHNLRIKISIMAEGDVITADTWAGFDVRGMDVHIRPNRPSYLQDEGVVLDMFSAPEPAVTVVSLKVDGQGWNENPFQNATADYTQSMFGLSCVGECATSNYKIINLSSGWSPGHHDVEVKLSVNGNTQSFFMGFDVNALNIFAMTDKFSYGLNENITLNVSVAYPDNGIAVSGAAVVATLYKAQPPNDILVTSVGGATDAYGKASIMLNATQNGFNYIQINVSGQVWFIGVQVSSLNVEITDAGGNPVSNNEYIGVADGSTSVVIRVNATIGDLPVPDGSEIRAVLWVFGHPEELPSNTTSSGVGTISFTMPPFAPAQVYGLELKVITPSGDAGYAPQATLRVVGGSAMQLEAHADRSFMQP